MVNIVEEKMESLKKYVPFIDYVLKIDQQKYIKFINIRKWIVQGKKNYPLSDLNKIEQSIITQYKNLLVEKNQIPQDIANVFAPMNLKQFVNLCSDDEEEDEVIELSTKTTPKVLEVQNRYSNTIKVYSELNIVDDSEDDLEFISIAYDNKTEKKIEQGSSSQTNKNRAGVKEDVEIDEESKVILRKIDKLAADDIKMKNEHEPNNYTYQGKGNEWEDITLKEEDIYQRYSSTTLSDVLFKRRADFNDDEVKIDSEIPTQIISLDSDSDSETCETDKKSLTILNSFADSSNKTNSSEIIEITLTDSEKIVENTVSNDNSSKITNNDENVKSICDSIDSVLTDENELLNEVRVANASTIDSSDEQTQEEVRKEENSVQPPCEKNINTTETPNLNPEQISKILEDISSKTDFELETLYEALLCVRQMNPSSPNTKVTENNNNSDPGAPSEPAPPAPPLTAKHFPIPPVHPCYSSQQQQLTQSVPPYVGMVPPRPKININDPRIKKELQAIQNSPLFTYNILNPDIENSIRKICEAKQLQLPHQQQQRNALPSSGYPNKNNDVSCSSSCNKSSISYGEYKRRQQEKKFEMERQREEDRKTKEQAQQMERGNSKLSESSEEYIRSVLLSTLKPCKDQLSTLWTQQKSIISNKSSKMKQQQQKAFNIPVAKNSNKNYKASGSKETKKNGDQKLNRIYNELRCTFKGFDQIQDFIPHQTTDVLQSDTNPSQAIESTPRNIGLRRRSSIHALSAISEQLGNLSSECSDSEPQQNINSKHSSIHSSENVSVKHFSKRRKTIDKAIKPRPKSLRIKDSITSSEESSCDDDKINTITKFSRVRSLRITDSVSHSEASSCDDGKINQITKEDFTIKEPIIKLRRLSQSVIRKYINKNKDCAGDGGIRLTKTCEKVQNTIESVQKKPKLKRYNNDCQMTERNTDICVLCRSKPSDLTNHYIGKHKTESYTARLDWSELDDLTINTPFAKLQPSSKNYRFERYEVECAFCKRKLVDRFINLYSHYSAHTGEYAFRCAHCHYSKPYRPDIQSHILHSKTCRNSSIQVMYRYPPQSQCIFLHYCTICNFTQLNEANVLKHLREHHSSAKATTINVQKCILAAINDGPDANEMRKPVQKEASGTSSTEIDFKVDDDDVPVSNEPCVEDEFLEEEAYSLEKQLKQMHRRPSSFTNTTMPTTVIHCIGNNEKNSPAASSTLQNSNSPAAQRHLPIIIKTELPDVEEKPIITPSPKSFNYNAKVEAQIDKPALKNDTVYEKYRSYPGNVSYLGLYKCMIGDCYYSTDCSEEMCLHLTEHISDESKPIEYLQCPYCIISMGTHFTPMQLVEHVRNQHRHLNFQCSVCCYRSCDASNVHIHQQMHHDSKSAVNTCKIYKCSGGASKFNDINNITLYEQIERNVSKIFCKVCNAGFFYTEILVNHLKSAHGVLNIQDLKIFSCIYCPYTVENTYQIRMHVATKHPGEQPIVYDHNKQISSINGDFKHISNAVNVSQSVDYIEAKHAICANITENITQDVKPNVSELYMNEETAKIRLRKLTAHTGVPPDNLYRCAESQCSGFFSVFELWLRHMKARHHAIECRCPHCPSDQLLPIDQFALHFEQHRLHTFICFYCSTTSPTEILASQHAAQSHASLGKMSYEKVHFNINFSYSIMIQSDSFKDREQFMAELLIILDNRLKDLENNAMKKLKQQWLVRDDTPWIEDYLHSLSNRKVARLCLVKNCTFRTLKDEHLYQHLRTSHNINGTQFNCSKCDFHVENCNSFDEICNHIKLHAEYIFICAACSLITSSRTKMSFHIGEQHSARDVPVIHLFRTNQDMYIKICIVFADNQLTFSTMRNCFCCSELNMSGDVFSLHLKRYHKLSLNYYCEKCPNFSFKLLNDIKPHFKAVHKSINHKIRCELAGPNDLRVTSLNDFQIQILAPDSSRQGEPPLLHIKNEPSDASDSDNVILLEDDDVVIQNYLRDGQIKPAPTSQPILKCTSLSKLMEPPVNVSSTPLLSLPTTSAFQTHFIAINRNSEPLSTVPSLPPASSIAQTPCVRYNLGPLNKYTNISVVNSLSINAMAAPAPRADTPLVRKNTFISSYQPQNGCLESLLNDPSNINTQHIPNTVYTPGQNYNIQKTPPVINNIPSKSPILMQLNYDTIPTQNDNKFK